VSKASAQFGRPAVPAPVFGEDGPVVACRPRIGTAPGLTSTILPPARSLMITPSATASKIARYRCGTSRGLSSSGARFCAVTLTAPGSRAFMQASAPRLRHLSHPPAANDRHKDRLERRCASPIPAPIMKRPDEAAERSTE
jgi:hypothetical protein